MVTGEGFEAPTSRVRSQVRTTIRDTPVRALTFAHEGLAQAETLSNDPARSPTPGTHQLYYERRGLLQQLAASPGADGPDPRQLELRAAELTAGLDAWTGGWFSEVRAARAAASGANTLD